MNRNLVARLIASAFVLVGVPPACIIPTPGLHSGEARRNVDAATPARFQPGKTTRAEVILALGEPDAMSADERKLGYRTEKVEAILLVGGYGGGGGASLERDEYLVCEFDTCGRLTGTKTSDHWITSSDPGRTLGIEPLPNKAVVWEGSASWLSGVDDYRTPGVAAGAEWLPGQLAVTRGGLEFRSRSRFGNAPPALSVPFREIAEVAEDKMLFGSLLAVHTRSGKHHAFQVYGKTTWHSDVEQLRKVRDLVAARLR